MHRWVEYEREELYELVWSKPMSQIAEEEGLSGRGLAKICEKMNIPRPPRGYWAKVQAGQRPRKQKLPKWKPGVPMVHRRRVQNVVNQVLADEAHNLIDMTRSATVFAVDDELSGTHSLLERDIRRIDGGLRGRRGIHDVDIQILTPDVLRRAVGVMDAILKSLEAQGYEVQVIPPQDNAESSLTCARIMGVDVPFGVDELQDTIKTFVPYNYPGIMQKEGRYEYSYEPNQKLALKIRLDGFAFSGMRRTWSDGDKQRVEDCIGAFIRGLIQVAGQMLQVERERQQRQREREEQRMVLQLARMRQEHERRLREDLDARLDKMRRADEILRLVAAVRRRHDEGALEWLGWAEGVAEAHLEEALCEPFPHVHIPSLSNLK